MIPGIFWAMPELFENVLLNRAKNKSKQQGTHISGNEYFRKADVIITEDVECEVIEQRQLPNKK